MGKTVYNITITNQSINRLDITLSSYQNVLKTTKGKKKLYKITVIWITAFFLPFIWKVTRNTLHLVNSKSIYFLLCIKALTSLTHIGFFFLLSSWVFAMILSQIEFKSGVGEKGKTINKNMKKKKKGKKMTCNGMLGNWDIFFGQATI